MHIFVIIGLFATWSMAFPLGKWLLQYSSPIFLTGIRMAFAGCLLVGWLFLRRKLPKNLSSRSFVALALLSICSIYLTNILEFWGLIRLSAAKTCFFYSLSPMIAAVLSYIHFKEKISKVKILGILIGMCGFVPALLEKSSFEDAFGSFLYFSWPELAIAAAAFFSVYGWILLRIVVKNDEISPYFANGFSMLFGGILALITSYFVDTWNPIPLTMSMITPFTLVLLTLTFLSNILCYNLYGILLKRYTATLLSFFGLFSPLFASIHEWVIFGTAPSVYILCSTAIVISGLSLYYREELKQGYIPQAKASDTV
ncbi:MAG: DMT family transporter [Chlamydiae bacterium]|nr:DMT family transporter [Chlamydiota bacterium]